MKTKKSVWVLRIVSLLFTVVIGVLIFSFSADDATVSSERSREVAEAVAPIVITDYNKKTPAQKSSLIGKLAGMLRKCAHAFEYLALGAFLSLFLLSFGKGSDGRGAEEQKKRRVPSKELLLLCALILCFLFAGLDEWHQTFVSGRSGEMRDVTLDFVSALCSCLLVWAGYRVAGQPGRKQKKREREKQ